MQIWKKGHKYYVAGLQFNLFQKHPDLILGWGAMHNKLGGQKIISIESEEELNKILDDVKKRRKYRKYELVADNRHTTMSCSYYL